MKLKNNTSYKIEFARGDRITMSSIKINEMVTKYYKACVLRFFPLSCCFLIASARVIKSLLFVELSN